MVDAFQNQSDARATGLEDDDNFFDLVSQRAGLDSREKALNLTRDVMLFVCKSFSYEDLRVSLHALPRKVLDALFLNNPEAPSFRVSLSDLERELQAKWNVDQSLAAHYALAVGLSVAETLPVAELQSMVASLPRDLRALFPVRASA